MRKIIVSCDICGEVFEREPNPGQHDKTRTRLVGNIVIELVKRGDREFDATEKLSLEVCESPKKDCRHKAVDRLIERVVTSEGAP